MLFFDYGVFHLLSSMLDNNNNTSILSKNEIFIWITWRFLMLQVLPRGPFLLLSCSPVHGSWYARLFCSRHCVVKPFIDPLPWIPSAITRHCPFWFLFSEMSSRTGGRYYDGESEMSRKQHRNNHVNTIITVVHIVVVFLKILSQSVRWRTCTVVQQV